MKALRILFSSLGVMALVGCGATTATTSATPVPSPTTDVAAARTAALTMFFFQTPAVGLPCSARTPTATGVDHFADCPFSATLKARLADLYGRNYFFSGPGGHCGGDYIVGGQNPLSSAPQVLSAVAESNGTVSVVIQRAPSVPTNLTAVMTNTNGTWLATDLAVGTGPSASIISATPNC